MFLGEDKKKNTFIVLIKSTCYCCGCFILYFIRVSFYPTTSVKVRTAALLDTALLPTVPPAPPHGDLVDPSPLPFDLDTYRGEVTQS